jgi:hypothetical protein
MGAFAALPLAYKMMIAATVASGAASARQSVVAGKAQKVEYEVAADQERDAAKARELDRRSRLVRALSSQVTTRAAQGLSMEGSPAAIAQADASAADLAGLTDRVNTSRTTLSLRRQGRQAARSGRISAATTLLDTAVNVGMMGAEGADTGIQNQRTGSRIRGGRRRGGG